MLSDSTILKKIERQPKRAAGFKQLVRELGLHGEQRRELDDRLDRLVARGQLIRVDADCYALPSASAGKNMIVGRLSMHRDGYVFVCPEPKSLEAHFKDKLAGDIFIPPPFIGSAMHGDRVLVEVGTIRPDGRAEGRIIRPANRTHTTVVGTFRYGSRYNYVIPIDEKIRQEIVIPPGMEYPKSHPVESEPDHSAGVSPAVKRASRPLRDDRDTGHKAHDGGGTKSVHRVLGEEATRRTHWDDLDRVVVDVEITDCPS